MSSMRSVEVLQHLWSALDHLCERDPEGYDKLMENWKKEGSDFRAKPELHSSIRTEVLQEPKPWQLYINLCSWSSVPAPQSPGEPIPLCMGQLETCPGEPIPLCMGQLETCPGEPIPLCMGQLETCPGEPIPLCTGQLETCPGEPIPLCTGQLETCPGEPIPLCTGQLETRPGEPIPLCTGQLETEDNRSQGPTPVKSLHETPSGRFSVLDVGVNPVLLHELQSSAADMDQLYLLLINMAQKQHSLRLSRRFTVVSPSPWCSPNDLRRRLGSLRPPAVRDTAVAGQTPACLLLQRATLQTEPEQPVVIGPETTEHKNNLIQVLSSTSVGPEQPRHQLQLELDSTPPRLELSVDLPRVSRVSQCQLRISKDDVLVEVEDVYLLVLDLPHRVDEDSASAVFNKKKRQLTLKVNLL